MPTREQKVSVLKVIIEGTNYFFDNYLFVLLFYLPFPAAAFTMYATNIVSDPYRLLLIPYLYVVIPASVILLFLYQAYVCTFFTLRVASRDGYFRPVRGSIAKLALRRLPGVVCMELVIMGAALTASMLFIIPGIMVLVSFTLAGYVYVLNGGISMSLEESHALINKNFGRVVMLFCGLLAVFAVQAVLNWLFEQAVDGIWAKAAAAVVATASPVFFFWLIALYKHIVKSRDFKHFEDRGNPEPLYRAVAILSFVAAIAYIAAPVAAGFWFWPQIRQAATAYEVKHDGARSTLYRNGIPIHSIEDTGPAKTAWYFYYPDGRVRSKKSLDLMTYDGENREYSPDGKVRSVQVVRRGVPGEKTITDPGSQITK